MFFLVKTEVLKIRKLNLTVLCLCLVTGCSQTQVWKMNDHIPNRLDQPERNRFDRRVQKFINMYNLSGEAVDRYVVNGENFILNTPMCLSKEWEEKLPYVICNADGDMTKCKRIK